MIRDFDAKIGNRDEESGGIVEKYVKKVRRNNNGKRLIKSNRIIIMNTC